MQSRPAIQPGGVGLRACFVLCSMFSLVEDVSVEICPDHIKRCGFKGFIPQIIACCLS